MVAETPVECPRLHADFTDGSNCFVNFGNLGNDFLSQLTLLLDIFTGGFHASIQLQFERSGVRFSFRGQPHLVGARGHHRPTITKLSPRLPCQRRRSFHAEIPSKAVDSYTGWNLLVGRLLIGPLRGRFSLLFVLVRVTPHNFAGAIEELERYDALRRDRKIVIDDRASWWILTHRLRTFEEIGPPHSIRQPRFIENGVGGGLRCS